MYMILFLILALFLIFMPQMFVKNTYREYLRFNAQSGLTGAEVAREILDKHGLSQVGIEAIKGELSDRRMLTIICLCVQGQAFSRLLLSDLLSVLC